MRSRPSPASKRRTSSRVTCLQALGKRLRADPRLGHLHALTAPVSERDVSLHVQVVLDDFVIETFKPRNVRDVTWGECTNTRRMPAVQVAGHRFYPDHIIRYDGLMVAIEVKIYTGRGDVVQQALGQALLYTQGYGFVVVFIADVTPAGGLSARWYHPLGDDRTFLDRLWQLHNIMVVCRRVRAE